MHFGKQIQNLVGIVDMGGVNHSRVGTTLAAPPGGWNRPLVAEVIGTNNTTIASDFKFP